MFNLSRVLNFNSGPKISPSHLWDVASSMARQVKDGEKHDFLATFILRRVYQLAENREVMQCDPLLKVFAGISKSSIKEAIKAGGAKGSFCLPEGEILLVFPREGDTEPFRVDNLFSDTVLRHLCSQAISRPKTPEDVYVKWETYLFAIGGVRTSEKDEASIRAMARVGSEKIEEFRRQTSPSNPFDFLNELMPGLVEEEGQQTVELDHSSLSQSEGESEIPNSGGKSDSSTDASANLDEKPH